MEKKLRRSSNGAMICGVCAGVAEFFDLDVSNVRLAWVLAVILGFGGVLYIIMALIVPKSEY